MTAQMAEVPKAVAAARDFEGQTSIDTPDCACIAAERKSLLPPERIFRGPKGPRQERALEALMTGGKLTNAQIRTVAGVANGPDVIAKLRDRGLCSATELVTEWFDIVDRDDCKARIGRWYLTEAGRAKVLAWMSSQPSGGRH